ncbi:hypothetical protein ACQJBY_067350 [Aegilops geniculata]
MEGQPMVSYSTGSMNSVVDKLTKLKNPPNIIRELRQDLVTLQADFFNKLARRREMNLQIGAWVKHVAELVFDIEDWLDQKPVITTDMGDGQSEIEEEAKCFKAQIDEALEICKRYKFVSEVPHLLDPYSCKVRTDTRVSLEEKPAIVPVHCSSDQLVKHLTSENEKMLKVVCIVGMEGLGKTTLAREIYARLQGEFECRAFVNLGRRPSMMATLMEILLQVKCSQQQQKQKKTKKKFERQQQQKKEVKVGTHPTLESGTTLSVQDQRKRRFTWIRHPRHHGKRNVDDADINQVFHESGEQVLQKLMTELWEFLSTKRYFIVVDGLWSTRSWRIINCALPNKTRGSMVLTTTPISDVARYCSVRPTDVIYQMEALSKEKSISLYLEATRQKDLPSNQAEVTSNMLRMCGGMPLAITVAAGLLTTKYYEEVTEPRLFAVPLLEQDSTSEGMMKILQMSYDALSLPLKSCLVYLSVFREDYIIKKDRLIRLWIAERLIPKKYEEIKRKETRDEGGEETSEKEKGGEGVEETGDGEKRGERVEETSGGEKKGEGEEITEGIEKRSETVEKGKGKGIECEETRGEVSLWETGEMYFNELIMRRLIQPVYGYDDDHAVGCTIHGVILDFVKSLSTKGNFIAFGADPSSGLFLDTVRRFSLDCYDDQVRTLASTQKHLSKVRSLTVLGDIEAIAGRSALTVSGKIEGISILPSFKLIRVLDLQDTDNLTSRHLEGIGGLILLRHLGVAGTAIDKLPEEIGELEQLETLDLRQMERLKILPASIAKQRRLAHLLIDGHVTLPREILKMQGFEEVSTIVVNNKRSANSVGDLLDKSEQLRVLGVRMDGSQLWDDLSVKLFLEKVARSTKLTSLSLDCQLHFDLLGLRLNFPPPEQLRRFELTLFAPIPRAAAHKMKSLLSVTHMDIEIFQLDDGCIGVLGGLPHLVLLKLVSSGNITPRRRRGRKVRCTVGVHSGFNSLKVFSLKCQYGGTELEFTSGAMQKLGRLSLEFSAWETLCLYEDFSFGIQHLSSLTRVHATINCKSAEASEVQNAEDAIREQVQGNFCTTEFSRKNQHMMLCDEANKNAFSKTGVYKFISRGTKQLHQKLPWMQF